MTQMELDNIWNYYIQVYNQLLNIYTRIHRKCYKKNLEKKVKNSIVSASTAYDGKVSEAATSIENDRRIIGVV